MPPELERIVRKTLEKDPEYRYQSAREMYIDLRNLQRDLETNNRTASVGQPITEHQATVLLTEKQSGAEQRARAETRKRGRGDDFFEHHRRAQG